MEMENRTQNGTQKYRMKRWLGVLLLTLLFALPLSAQAASKNVQTLTIRKGQTYDIYANCGYGELNYAEILTQAKGTSYDAIFYSSSAGGSRMYMEHKKSEKKIYLTVCGLASTMEERYGEKEPERLLLASIRVKKGSVKVRMYQYPSPEKPKPRLAKFQAKKVTHPIFKAFTLKKGQKRTYVLGKRKGLYFDVIDYILRVKTNTTLTETWDGGKQIIKFKSAKGYQCDRSGKQFRSFGYDKKSGSYRYIQWMNLGQTSKMSANKEVVLYFPYLYNVKAK